MKHPMDRRSAFARIAPLAALLLAGCGGGGAAVTAPGEEPDTVPGTPPNTPTDTTPTAPMSATVTTPDRAFSPAAVTIAAGGTVTWQITDEDHDLTWIGAAPPGGDAPRTEEGSSISRTFPTAGTYRYQCAKHADKGMAGTVEVVGTGNPPATPQTATVATPGVRFSPAEVTVLAGGTVTWQVSGARHNVTFQGAAPPGGSVPDTDPGGSAARTFPERGSYPYVCTRHAGMTGRVTVQ